MKFSHLSGDGDLFRVGCSEEVKEKQILTMNKREYVLAKFSPSDTYDYIRQSLQQFQFSGDMVILAHVERYNCITEEPSLAEELEEMGILLRVIAGSLIGNSGRKIKNFVRELMDEDLVSCVETDAYDVKRRASRMKKAADYVKKNTENNI